MWKRVLAIGVLFAIGLPVYGKQEGGKPGGDQGKGNPTQPPPPSPNGVVTCAIKQDGTTIECQYPQAHPQGYFRRLFSAENLPNLLLFAVGLGGIGVAICTLRKLERQTKLTERAVEIAQQTLVHTQRPKIEVRTFYFTETFMTSRKSPFGIEDGSTVSGQFYVVNKGGTDATIEGYLCEAYIGKTLPAKRPYEGKSGTRDNKVLVSGQSESYLFGMKLGETLDKNTAGLLDGMAINLWVLGWFDYRDELGISRTTRFCRRYDRRVERFIPVDDVEYESVD